MLVLLLLCEVVLLRHGRADMKGLLQSTTKGEFLRHLTKQYERHLWLGGNCPPNYKPRPDSILQGTLIADMVFYHYYYQSTNQ